MRAAFYSSYGGPEVISIRELSTPAPTNDEILIRVKAASINSWDWDLIKGDTIFSRMWGLFKPRVNTPGCDMAGVVEAVGGKVTQFKPGDAVMGDLCECGFGTFAEYVCAKEKALIKKPDSISFVDAASLPQAGALAIQGIQYNGVLRGKNVLINGAAGGVGTLAIQLAKRAGANVTAVDALAKHDLLQSLGADRLIDYQSQDFAALDNKYDLVLDVIATRSPGISKRVLTGGGMYVIAGGTTPVIFQTMMFGGSVKMLMLKPNGGLTELVDLVERKEVVPVIDKVYSLNDIADAVRHFGSGGVRGKVIIQC